MAIFGALMIVGATVLLPTYGHQVFMAYTLVLVGLLVGVCWLKGEPPRWHWGDSNR
jgi:O-antigen/teichoic acid export membrane protein